MGIASSTLCPEETQSKLLKKQKTETKKTGDTKTTGGTQNNQLEYSNSNYFNLQWDLDVADEIFEDLVSSNLLIENDRKIFVQFLKEALFWEKRTVFYYKLSKARDKFRGNTENLRKAIGETINMLDATVMTNIQNEVLYAKDWDLFLDKYQSGAKWEYQSKPEPLLEKFGSFKNRWYDPKALYSYYFELPDKDLVEEDLDPSITHLPIFLYWNMDLLALRGFPKDQILQILNSQIKSLKESSWVVRLILATLGHKDRKEMYSFFDYFTLFGISLTGVAYGMNHSALQIGPYYMHYTTSDLVTFHDVEKKTNAFVMLYPYKRWSLKYSEENMLKLCQVIVTFNMIKYDDHNCNCHHFVDAVFESIQCPPFPHKGPIANFLSLVKYSNTGVNHMKIVDLSGKTIEFRDHAELRAYCQTPLIKDLIVSPPDKLPKKDRENISQFLEVLKAVERGFQIQQPHNKFTQELIFPQPLQHEVGSVLHHQIIKFTTYTKSKT